MPARTECGSGGSSQLSTAHVHVAARTRVSSARPVHPAAVSLFSLLGMGKNSNVTKRKTFHDADLAAEKEQDAKKAEKRKKTQAKLLAKVLTGPAVVSTPMDEERMTEATGDQGRGSFEEAATCQGSASGSQEEEEQGVEDPQATAHSGYQGQGARRQALPSGRRCQAMGAPFH